MTLFTDTHDITEQRLILAVGLIIGYAQTTIEREQKYIDKTHTKFSLKRQAMREFQKSRMFVVLKELEEYGKRCLRLTGVVFPEDHLPGAYNIIETLASYFLLSKTHNTALAAYALMVTNILDDYKPKMTNSLKFVADKMMSFIAELDDIISEEILKRDRSDLAVVHSETVMAENAVKAFMRYTACPDTIKNFPPYEAPK